ncbi:MAG: acyl-CoA thioesterase [Oceanicaulis sp.]
MTTKPAPPDRDRFAFRHRLRVRWSEVDPQGIVFNPNYLVYADVALTEFWRAAGIDYGEMLETRGIDTFMVNCRADWFASAHFDEEIEIGMRVERVGRTSLVFAFAVFGPGGSALVSGALTYVFARPGPPRTPETIPAELVSQLQAFEDDLRKGA